MCFTSWSWLWWLWNTGYTATLPQNYYELEARGMQAATVAAKRHGTQFRVGSATNVLCMYFHVVCDIFCEVRRSLKECGKDVSQVIYIDVTSHVLLLHLHLLSFLVMAGIVYLSALMLFVWVFVGSSPSFETITPANLVFSCEQSSLRSVILFEHLLLPTIVLQMQPQEELMTGLMELQGFLTFTRLNWETLVAMALFSPKSTSSRLERSSTMDLNTSLSIWFLTQESKLDSHSQLNDVYSKSNKVKRLT